MRAGALRHRATIQQSATTADPEYGGAVTTWTDVATVWASVRDLSGRELDASATVGSEVTTEVVIRARKDVTADMRVLVDGRTLRIAAVQRGNVPRQLVLRCTEVT